MDKRVFTVYDCKAETYFPPTYYSTKAEALRAFSRLANDKDVLIGVHPEDYTLFEIGSFSLISGLFTLYPTKISLGLAVDFVDRAPVLPELKAKG